MENRFDRGSALGAIPPFSKGGLGGIFRKAKNMGIKFDCGSALGAIPPFSKGGVGGIFRKAKNVKNRFDRGSALAQSASVSMV